MAQLKHAGLLTSALLLSSMPVSAELASLNVTVTDLAVNSGTIEVSLFDNSEAFLVTPFLQTGGEVTEDGKFFASFSGIAEGEYAIVVVHDENGNGIYDTGFLGFGAERLGYSNNVRSFLGRPDFDDTKFLLNSGLTEIEIKLQ
jgi:uncharacterized protein (DUF2141 family)